MPFQCDTFDFVDDYSKVTYGMQDMLQLIRKDDNDALFRTGPGKVAWSVPIIQANDVRKVNLYIQEYCCK